MPPAAVFQDLLDPAHLEGSPVFLEGSLRLAGTRGHLVNMSGTVSSSFSIVARVSQTPGTSGYILAKSTPTGSRYYGLWGTQNSGRVYFYYRTPGSSNVRSVVWSNVNLNNGAVRNILFTVVDDVAMLVVDGRDFGQRSLNGPVDDCGSPSPSCQLFVGQRPALDSTFFLPFNGAIFNLRLYQEDALSEFPDLSETTTTPAPTTPTTSPTTTPTTTATVTERK